MCVNCREIIVIIVNLIAIKRCYEILLGTNKYFLLTLTLMVPSMVHIREEGS